MIAIIESIMIAISGNTTSMIVYISATIDMVSVSLFRNMRFSSIITCNVLEK